MVKSISKVIFSVLVLSLMSATAFAQDDDSGVPAIADEEDAEPVEVPPAAAPAPARFAPPVAGDVAPAPAEPTQYTETKISTSERLFGTYRLHIGMAKPDLSDYAPYDNFYKEPSIYPTFGFDVFAYDWYVTLGGRFNIGYYVDKGYESSTAHDQGYNKVPGGKLELTMIPVQAALTFETTVFKRKWLVLSGWGGYERMYFQDLRVVPGTKTTAAASRKSLIADDTTTESNKSYVQSGWKSGTVMGAALSISLAPISDGTVNTMEDVMGLKSIYITPFIEIAKYGTGLGFSRTAMGVAFTFESVR